MICKFCKVTLAHNAIYCHNCGKKQIQHTKKRRRRAQSQGTITRLSGTRHNPYWARMPADYSNGIPVRQSLGCFQSYAAAAEALANAMYVPEKSPNHKETLTLHDIYERFVSSFYYDSLSPSAQRSHSTAWKYLSHCASIPISEINKDTFQKPINAMQEKHMKRESLAKVRNLASKLCQEAMGLGLITVNYGKLIQLPKSDTVPPKPFSSEHIRLLWATADSGDPDAMAVLILIYTGMRPGELLSVDIGVHLHIDGDYWYIQHGSKTNAGRNRIIPLPGIIHPLIKILIDSRTSGPLIATVHGGYWDLDNWRARRFRGLMDRLGLNGYVPYSCRHTYANLLKNRQIDPLIAMEVFGHRDYGTTVARYQSTTSEDISYICASVDGFKQP